MKYPARERRFGFRFGCFLIVLVLVAGVGVSGASAATKVNFLRNATSAFDHYTSGATLEERAWINAHYWRMRGYTPFFDQALGWAPPTSFYSNLYALYRDASQDQVVMQQHPDWVLRDPQGNGLFIPADCSGQSCTQYAADVGHPGWRAYWIQRAQNDLAKGYEGTFVDDVNLEMRVSNGAGTFVRPVDPRTGQLMTDADWRRYMAEFVEAISAAMPSAVIAHNTHWWLSHSDPHVQREVDAADTIELERGFNDPGIVAGDGIFGFLTFLEHIDWLHSRGKSLIFEPYNLDAEGRHYALSSYYMVREASDALASDSKADPDDWWVGWGADIGEPEGARFKTDGYYKRKFSDGIALMNGLGGGNDTINLSSYYRWKTVSGTTVTSVTIGPREGRVLYKFPL
jgi:hypothetical protein